MYFPSVFDSGLDIVQDILRLLKTRIIGSDDREISQSSGDLRHLKAAGFGTVSATAKEADQSARLVLFFRVVRRLSRLIAL